MRKIFLITLTLLTGICGAQIIDWQHFDEKRMDSVMFDEMNQYVKRTHNGDSLILSKIVQDQIMTDNYSFIRDNCRDTLIHNPRWAGKFVLDSIKMKIINEMPSNSNFIKGHWDEKYKFFWDFDYVEIIGSVSYNGYNYSVSYQTVAKRLIIGWNSSIKGHKEIMNADFRNIVINGVSTYYNRSTHTVIVSFVYIG